jgi:thiol:disulfide interchange protein
MSGLKKVFFLSLAACAIVFTIPLSSPVDAKEVMSVKEFTEGSKLDAQSSKLNAKGLKWNTELSKGLEQAKKEQKYVLADVYTDWCGWCKRLDADTFSDPGFVAFANQQFVCVKANAEDGGEGQHAARENKVTGYPCALVYNNSGKVIGRISGYMKAKQYEDRLMAIIKNPSP